MTAFGGLRRQGGRFRDLVVRHRIAEIMFYVLIASFFVLDTRLHRNLFYLFLPFFIARLARDDINRTANRVATEQRTLWSAQDFQSFDI